MGLADRFKDLKSKAEDAVVEHSDQIHSAVEKATTVADQRTKGRYSERIQQVGAKADNLVHSLKDGDAQDTHAQDTGTQHSDAQGADLNDAAAPAGEQTAAAEREA
jgi:hypothetical protein